MIRGSGEYVCPICMNPPSVHARLTIIYGICLALRYLHPNQPILMHGGGSQRISWWRKFASVLMKAVRAQSCSTSGTRGWHAPELQTATPPEASATTDAYSFGSVTYIFCFDLEAPHRASGVACKQHYTRLPANHRKCLRANPTERPTMAGVHDEVVP